MIRFGVLRARVVRGHDHMVGVAGHRSPHQGALAAVPVAAAAEQGCDPGLGEGSADGGEDGLQGVRGVGEVDDQGPVADDPALEAPVHWAQVLPVGALPGAQDAVRQCRGQGIVLLGCAPGPGRAWPAIASGLRAAGLSTSIGTRGSPSVLQAPRHLRAGAEEPPAVLDQIKDARLGCEIGRLVPVIVQMVLREVGPAGVL